MKLAPIYLLLGALLLAACGPGDARLGGSGLAGTRWELVSFGPVASPMPLVADSRITLEFDDADHAGGSAGCNAYGGSYRAVGGSLRFADLLSTAMACADGAVMQQEQEYLRALGSASSYLISDGALTILYDGGAAKLNFARSASSL